MDGITEDKLIMASTTQHVWISGALSVYSIDLLAESSEIAIICMNPLLFITDKLK